MRSASRRRPKHAYVAALSTGEWAEEVSIEPFPRWRSPSLVRCACSNCGTHAYRRLVGVEDGPLACMASPVACSVCGSRQYTELDLPLPLLGG